ncbi:hypothetical protein EVAR_98330_1 [Eumeta japonica]|uniref:Uncharacterized protein n=1 Tax=Eumeta variegata TaxID=151549 RepID=A0A4C1XB57_EUMVA|nr:hypothetical protein EVAR_98330_1 [Eumeta japonica]
MTGGTEAKQLIANSKRGLLSSFGSRGSGGAPAGPGAGAASADARSRLSQSRPLSSHRRRRAVSVDTILPSNLAWLLHRRHCYTRVAGSQIAGNALVTM